MAEKKKDPILETLEVREKKLDVIKKISDMRRSEERYTLEQQKEQLEIDKKEIECDKLRNPNLFFELYILATASVIDEEKSIGSEAVYKNLFSQQELDIIKKKIINKVKLL